MATKALEKGKPMADPFANETEPIEGEIVDMETGEVKTPRAERGTFSEEVGLTPAPRRISEVLPEPTVYKSEDVEGEDILLFGWKFSSGEFGEFVIMQIERSDGEAALLTCGGVTVLQKMKLLQRAVETEKCNLPVIIRMKKIDLGKKGFAPMWDIE